MPGDPQECRLNALRCLTLARRARRPEARQNFAALAETWTKLAAELELTKRFSARFLSLNSASLMRLCPWP